VRGSSDRTLANPCAKIGNQGSTGFLLWLVKGCEQLCSHPGSSVNKKIGCQGRLFISRRA